MNRRRTVSVRTAEFDISEHHLANVAIEFGGKLATLAGVDDEHHVEFVDSVDDEGVRIYSALLIGPFEQALESYRRPA